MLVIDLAFRENPRNACAATLTLMLSLFFKSELFLYAILLINRIFFLIKGKTDNAVKKQVEIANKLKRFSAATEKKIMRP